MRCNKFGMPMLGFVILSVFFSLVFIVNIALAVGKSGYGPSPDLDQVYYSIWLDNLIYNPATTSTSSEHSVYVYNGEAHQIVYGYEFKHKIVEPPSYENTLLDSGTLSSGNSFYRYSKQTMYVGGLQQGNQYTLSCYTRVHLQKPRGQTKDDQVSGSISFRR